MSEAERSARLLREIFLAEFMAGLPAENIAWAARRISGSMVDLRLHEGDVVYREGDPSTDQFFIVQGELKLEAPGKPDWRLGDRSLVGAIDLMLDRPRARTVTATRDTHLLRVRADDWFDLLEDNFEFTQRGLQGLATGVRTVQRELDRHDATGHERRPARRDRELDLVGRVFALRDVPLFANTDVQSLTSLAALAHEMHLLPESPVFPTAESRAALLLVLDGVVTVTHPKISMPAAYEAGALVFGSAAVSPAEPEYEARAAAGTRVLRISHEDYFDVMEEHFSLARSAFKTLVAERELLTDASAISAPKK